MLEPRRLACRLSQRNQARPFIAGLIGGRRQELCAFFHSFPLDSRRRFVPNFHVLEPTRFPTAAGRALLQAPRRPFFACDSRSHAAPSGSPPPDERTPPRSFRPTPARPATPAAASYPPPS